MPSLRGDDILPCCGFCGRHAGRGAQRFFVGTISEMDTRICSDCLALASEDINVADPLFTKTYYPTKRPELAPPEPGVGKRVRQVRRQVLKPNTRTGQK